MALKIYSDSGALNEILPNESFDGTGVTFTFGLTGMTGTDVGSVYLENFVSFASESFTDGVSSVLNGAAYTVDELIGMRVYHNKIFVGTVTSNTADTVTISDLTYTQGSFILTLSSYEKKTLTTHYSIGGNSVIFLTAPTTSQKVHVVPSGTLNINFGGNIADAVTKTSTVYLKRTPGFVYGSLKFYIEDLSADVVASTTADITFASGVGGAFVGLTVDALVGLAVDHKGVFVGMIISNDATTITIDDAGYTDAVAGDVHIYSVSTSLCSLDNVTYERVVHPADIDNDAAVAVYIKDTVDIPNEAMNYPNQTIRLSGIPYVE